MASKSDEITAMAGRNSGFKKTRYRKHTVLSFGCQSHHCREITAVVQTLQYALSKILFTL